MPTWTWHLATPKISSGVGIPKRSFGSFRHKATRTRVGTIRVMLSKPEALRKQRHTQGATGPLVLSPLVEEIGMRAVSTQKSPKCCEHAKKKHTPPLQKTAKGQWEPAEALQLCVQNSCFFFLISPDLQTVPRSHLKAGFCAPRDLDLNQRGGNWK